MKKGETLKAYSYQYWKLYNEIGRNNWGWRGRRQHLQGWVTYRFRAKEFPYYKPHGGYAKADVKGKR